MFSLMPDQWLAQFIAWSHVDGVPKASPTLKATGLHVEQDWAFGGADHSVAAACAALYAVTTAAVWVAAQMAFTRASSAL